MIERAADETNWGDLADTIDASNNSISIFADLIKGNPRVCQINVINLTDFNISPRQYDLYSKNPTCYCEAPLPAVIPPQMQGNALFAGMPVFTYNAGAYEIRLESNGGEDTNTIHVYWYVGGAHGDNYFDVTRKSMQPPLLKPKKKEGKVVKFTLGTPPFNGVSCHASCTGSKWMTLDVFLYYEEDATPSLKIDDTALATSCREGLPFFAALRVHGGTPPYSMQPSDVEPFGLSSSFDEDSGVLQISGEPSGDSDTYTVSLSIEDSSQPYAQSVVQSYTLSMKPSKDAT